MSSAYSSNTVEDGVRISINVLNEATQQCQTQVLESLSLDITGNKGGSINIGDIDWSQVIDMNINCTQTSTSQSSIDNSLQQTISQVAKAVAQAFSIPGNSAQSQNNTDLWTEIGTSIKNVYNQKCKNLLETTGDVRIVNNTNEDVTFASLNFNQQIDGMVNCIQTDSTVSDVKNKIVQNIEQKAESIIESLLGPLFTILLIIIVVIGVILFGGVKAVTNWKFLIVIAIIITVYIILALTQKWWPFR